MAKKYYEKIDVLRGFAILLVVLGHALDQANILTDSVEWCNNLHAFIYSFHMPLFFAISGFCVFSISNYAQFVKKKVRYILLPYIVFNVIIIPLRMLLPQFSLVSNGIKDTIVSILLYGGETWFLYVLFIIFLIAPLLIKIIANKINRFIIVEVFLIVVYFLVHNITVFDLSQVIYYMIFFLAGNMLQKRELIGEKNNFSRQVIFGGTLIVLLAQIGLLCVSRIVEDCVILVLLLKILMAVVGCLFSYVFVDMITQKTIRGALKNYGNYSLQIYLFNGYFISLSRTVFLSMLGLPIPIVVLLNFVFGFFVNYIWCYLILKIPFARLLCGKRE